MTRAKKHITAIVILVVALTSVDLWSWSILESRVVAADQAGHDLAFCRQLASRINRMKEKPMVAGSHEMEITELSKCIEDAAVGCRIEPSSLVRISPESARRLGDSFYLEKPTTVVMEGVSLRQLTEFLYAMSSGPAAMNVQSLRITAPREQETGDRWSAEVTLSYLIYAPQQDGNSPRASSTVISTISTTILIRSSIHRRGEL